MKRFRWKKTLLVIIIPIAVIVIFTNSSNRSAVDFNTQIKPIINKKCIICHGGVKAKSNFSLLFRDEALGKTKSGKPAIIPGDPDHSELIRRISSNDAEERMPYKHEPLSDEEISIFRNWIRQGAKWGRHWAYIPVKKVPVPAYEDLWIRNEVDQFVWEKLQQEGLSPSPDADRETLLRRVSLDLIGMPAPDSMARSFLRDSGEAAYEKLVDGLISLPDFGEKWATMWLDLARYADTRGYEADNGRSIWRYRDWVIDAFNQDLPYDSFLTEQIAGDLLPDPTDAQYIATGFHRNTMTNDEGGTDNEEFRTAAVLDRVNTTWTAILGTTFGCVQCHSHPYDPFRHNEYYKFMAFFNNSRDEDTRSEYPLLFQFKPADSLALQGLRNWLETNVSHQDALEWYHFLKTWQPTINSLQCDRYQNAALVSSWYAGIRNKGSCRLPNTALDNRREFLIRYVTYKKGGVLKIHLDSLNGPQLANIALPYTKSTWDIRTVKFPPVAGRHDLYFSYHNPQISNPDENGILFDWFRVADPLPGKGKPGYKKAFKQYNQVLNAVSVTTTPILVESTPDQYRKTYVFERGNWRVKGDLVKPDIPAVFGGLPASAPHNRLGLAQWICSKSNPLTARTMVNRLWEQLFGHGIVETLEDFGTQGALPTHQALLDWMAWSFINTDRWSMKKMIRKIVLSSTYRQSSAIRPELAARDPYNTWYARGPRVRLSAEAIRDQALEIAGVLNEKMYGPGIMPYQPPGIWNSPYNGSKWIQSEGSEQYRRSVYIYWKRSAGYPSTITFDGPPRQVCVARRIRTNTPLQALTLLNDPAYLDIARKFAYRLMKEVKGPDSERISRGYQLATGHRISNEKLAAMEKLYSTALNRFRNDGDKTCEMIGEMGPHTNAETAALVVVTNTLLNLDEVIMKY